MGMKPKAPTNEEWKRLPLRVRLKIVWWIWMALHPLPPRPVQFSISATLFMFFLLPLMPAHLISIPITIGGGLAGALLFHGR